MNTVFADTGFWIGYLDPRDELHSKVMQVYQDLAPVRIVTSHMVLTELLNALSRTDDLRRSASRVVDAMPRRGPY